MKTFFERERTGPHKTSHGAHIVLVLLCALCVSAVLPRPAQAQNTDQLAALTKLNEVRQQNGIPPLAWNAQLEKAAQRHSTDMAEKGFVDEVGSDGSSSRQRVEQAGYAKWPSVRVWGESIYAGQTSFDEALNFFLGDDVQKRALLNSRLREVGIGVARDGLRIYWTVTLGAQPNLLPVFINEGAAATNDRQVAVLLTQEDAVPNGDGNAIGRVVEVRISDKPDFGTAAWQPWESLLPFTLSRGTGTKTIYVQMRDGAGRTTLATDTIEYDPNSRDTVKPVGPGALVTLPPPTPLPTEAPATATPAPSPTLLPTLPALPAQQTSTALLPPTPTAVEIGNPVVVDATSTAPAPTPTTALAAMVMGQTPTSAAVMVFVEPTATATPLGGDSANDVTTVVLTPSADEALPGTMSPQTNAQSPALPGWLLPAYVVVQLAVIVVGLAVFIRRK